MEDKKPNYYGHRERLRKRFLKTGLSGLADHEVVELLLTLAIPRHDTKEQAKALLAQFGNLKGILDAPLEEVRRIPGLGPVAPVALKFMRGAAALYLQQTAEQQTCLAEEDPLFGSWQMRMGSLPHEVFEVGYLDSGCRLLRDVIETLEEGTIDRAAVYPRKVVEAVLRRGAAALVFAHNHPNGDVRVTEQDKVLTRALVMAAAAVQLKVFDHLIVSADQVFSFHRPYRGPSACDCRARFGQDSQPRAPGPEPPPAQ